MSSWSMVVCLDGEPLAAVPAHVEDVASVIAPALVAMFGGPVSVGRAIAEWRLAHPAPLPPVAAIPGQLTLEAAL